MTNYSKELLKTFVWQVIRKSSDALILSEDLTFNGKALSHQRLAEKLRQIEEAGIPVLGHFRQPRSGELNGGAVRGDRCRLAKSVTAKKFSEFYRDFGYNGGLDPIRHLSELCNGTTLQPIGTNSRCQYDGQVHGFLSDSADGYNCLGQRAR